MKRSLFSLVLGLVLALAFLVLLPVGIPAGRAADDVIYVDCDAKGENTGESWTNAFTSLQVALEMAEPTDQIWVAAGVYTPTDGITRTATFWLEDGVALYGGFAGGDDAEGMNDRDWQNNVTILSGDLDGNDITEGGVVTTTDRIVGDNAYHVVTASGVTTTAVLDGFTITAGKADGGYGDNGGGGMFNRGGSPTLTHLVFRGNLASGFGGGMDNYDQSTVTLTDVLFDSNRAGADGGGMHVDGNHAVLVTVTFKNNWATYGGGLFIWYDSSATLTNVVFDANHGRLYGGGMNGRGVLEITNSTFRNNSANAAGGLDSGGDLVMANVSFNNNLANIGGGMINRENAKLTNVIFSGNRSNDWEGGGIYNGLKYDSKVTLTNVAFIGNEAKGGGGMYNELWNNSTVAPGNVVTLTNVIFSGNKAGKDGGNEIGRGGGMLNTVSNGNNPAAHGGSIILTNVTFSGNQADDFGGGLYNEAASPTLVNCILWGNDAYTGTEIYSTEYSTPTIKYSNIRGGSVVSGNIDADPLFVNPVLAVLAPTTAGDYRLLATSPVIDTGDDTAPGLNTITTDLQGRPRFVDVPEIENTGNGIVDMGAYELVSPSLTMLASYPNPSVFGQSVIFTATVTSLFSSGLPTGSVDFLADGELLGTGMLNENGVATYTTSTFSGGTHIVTARYNGDANFDASISSPFKQVVNRAASNTGLDSAPNPALWGQPIFFTATVSVDNAVGIPTGVVNFYDGTAFLSSGALDAGGVVTCTTSTLITGAHTILAYYPGDMNFGESIASLGQLVWSGLTSYELYLPLLSR